MAPIRVLHLARVINRYDFIDTIVRYLPRERFTLEVATFERESNIQSPEYEKVGIPHHIIPVPHMRAYGAYVRAAFQLARLLREREIDILHTHHFWEGIVGALAKLLYPGIKLIIHRHYTQDVVRVGGWKSRVLLKLEQFSYRHADRLVVPTKTIADFVEALYPLHKRLTPREIPYGFEFEASRYQPLSQVEREAFRQQHGVSEGDVVIANIGSHRLQKGQHDLIKAFTRLRQAVPYVKLWLIGEGPDTPFLREIVTQEKVEVHFWGWQRGERLRQLVGAADIIAHPSYSEAFPQVMVEALALERALLITEVSGVRETLQHGENAWIIQPGDVHGLFEGLYQLAKDASLRERLGKAGRQLVLEKLHYSAINPTYEALYTELCSR